MEETHLRKIAANIIACGTSGLPVNRKRSSCKQNNTDSDRTESIIKGFSTSQMHSYRTNYRKIAEEEIRTSYEMGIELIFKSSTKYPSLLRNIFSPPDYIYAKGNTDLLNRSGIAIVGARKCTSYSHQVLTSLIPPLCRSGLTIVSGMAYGVDSIAHRIALDNNGTTIGVNAGGLLKIYPSGNIRLTSAIASNGCIISELPLKVSPRPHHFPVRNRIISGITSGTVVIEAKIKSGSLVTAGIALEQNREVMAVPGSVLSPMSSGTNHLIKSGAAPVTSAEDIAEQLGIDLIENRDVDIELNSKEKKLLDLMVENKVISIDYMVEHLDLPVSEVVSIAMGMVLKNAVTEEPGGYRKII